MSRSVQNATVSRNQRSASAYRRTSPAPEPRLTRALAIAPSFPAARATARLRASVAGASSGVSNHCAEPTAFSAVARKVCWSYASASATARRPVSIAPGCRAEHLERREVAERRGQRRSGRAPLHVDTAFSAARRASMLRPLIQSNTACRASCAQRRSTSPRRSQMDSARADATMPSSIRDVSRHSRRTARGARPRGVVASRRRTAACGRAVPAPRGVRRVRPRVRRPPARIQDGSGVTGLLGMVGNPRGICLGAEVGEHGPWMAVRRAVGIDSSIASRASSCRNQSRRPSPRRMPACWHSSIASSGVPATSRTRATSTSWGTTAAASKVERAAVDSPAVRANTARERSTARRPQARRAPR